MWGLILIIDKENAKILKNIKSADYQKWCTIANYMLGVRMVYFFILSLALLIFSFHFLVNFNETEDQSIEYAPSKKEYN